MTKWKAGNKNLTLCRLYEDRGELGENVLTHLNKRERVCDSGKNGKNGYVGFLVC
jgi:hypothetical protein